ncbi:1,4-alpha-glucan branching enzyme, partial [Streptomyces sp. ME109]|uniref:1,4-alpha-glucan branching enzyme n=1 Tax=Streptomyces sp. me109 TaxID=1827853 RepID=UPI0021C641F8
MDAADRARLLSGSHHDPHSLLGAHEVPGGVVFRVLRPYAQSVAVVVDGRRATLTDLGDGLFTAVLPLDAIPDYVLSVTYAGRESELQDPYRFLPALGETDLHLIGEGRHEELWRALGAHLMTHQGVTGTRFTVWAPNARGVRVCGPFSHWDGTAFPMRSLGATGVWELFVPGIGEGELYKFEITRPDGTRTVRADPMARRTEVPPATASIVTGSSHVWRDDEWMEQRGEQPVHEAPFSVYEVHLASWRPGLTYRQLAQQLPAYVADLGFTHVELMPVAEHPFGGSWGYQVTGFYAPTARLGTPDDFKHPPVTDPAGTVTPADDPLGSLPAHGGSPDGASGTAAVPAFTGIGPGDRERLLSGTHHDPHGVLGAHPVPGGVAFLAFRPYALGVTVVTDDLRAELHDDGDGFFSALLPLRAVPDAYRLLVAYEGTVQDTEDAYRFLPALGELDLHLLGEGRHEQLWRALGAEPMVHQGVAGTRFTVWAPNARGVRLAGTFNFWDGTGFPMRSLGATGVWELFVPGIGEGELYKFEITRPDGTRTVRADPMARRTEVPPATSSIVHTSHHTWHDEEWMAERGGRPAHEAPFSVYEVHLASWRPGLTYRQLAQQLPAYVADLGFTHVELMPVAEHPFGGSWGYQVTGFYAPTARLGTPDDFKHLVDALHQAGIGVLMDWVPAHFPRDEWALAAFDGRPLYEHADPQRAAHPDWGTLEFDYGRREVRNFLVANAVYWCQEFHIDGLRVDAVASMLYLDYSREPGRWTPNEHGGRENLDAVAFLQEMNATVYRRNPGIVTIAEESTAWDGVTRAT